jgi:hypothetical protein
MVLVKCGNGPDIYASDYCFATFDLGSAFSRDQVWDTDWLVRLMTLEDVC